MLGGTKYKDRSRGQLLSRSGVLWILVALAGCSSQAGFDTSDRGIATAAWEGGDDPQVSVESLAGVTAMVEQQDATGIENELPSAPLDTGSGSDSETSHLDSNHTGGTCLLPSGVDSTSLSMSPDTTSTAPNPTTSSSSRPTTSQTTTSTSQAPTTSTSQAPTTSTSQTTSETPSPVPTTSTSQTPTSTEPDNTDSAGAAELCGVLPFDAAWLRQKLSEFTGAEPTSLFGAPGNILGERSSTQGRAIARTWLAEQYDRLGYRLASHRYSGGSNIFVERQGTGDGVIIVSSHYDTVAGTVGADDDGSGVIVGLAVAAALARCQPEKTVRIMHFDQEENGMVGSRAYVRSLRDSGEAQNIAGVIQVEMAGYDRNNDGFINRVDCGHTNNRFIVDSLSATISNENLDLTPIGDCQGQSDHVSFWDANIPAITVSELFFGASAERNPCYHRTCDTVDNLNFNFMNKIARAIALTTIALSEAR